MEKMQKLRGPPDPKDKGFSISERDDEAVSPDVELQDSYDGDEDQLARLGKKQVLTVRNEYRQFSQLPY